MNSLDATRQLAEIKQYVSSVGFGELLERVYAEHPEFAVDSVSHSRLTARPRGDADRRAPVSRGRRALLRQPADAGAHGEATRATRAQGVRAPSWDC